MRVTGGFYKGRKIKCPPGIIRPAMDRMRESLFSSIGDIHGLSFLDLFSGSGIVGIEAASRGANPIVLVEKDYKKKFVMKENVRFVEQDLVMEIKPVEKYIKSCDRQYDIIYLDPPFDMPGKEKIIRMIEEKKLLPKDGILLIHLPKEDVISDQIGELTVYKTKTYGRSFLKFYAYGEE